MDATHYSIVADALSKFQSAPIAIQALCIVAWTVTVLGLAYFLKEIVLALLRRADTSNLPAYQWRDEVPPAILAGHAAKHPTCLPGAKRAG
jgi:hypothetical protein